MTDARAAGDWLLQQEIGAGSFAKVWRATHKGSKQVAAVKEINLDKLNKKLQESLASEVAVLNHTKHTNIVCLLDLIREQQRLFIVLEFCAGGDLGAYLKRYRQVSEATARYFLLQLAEGLKELRRHNVIHRDLKPQNLLLSDTSSSPVLKIADFGFARSLAPQGLAETLCGSPLYMAPEILQFHKYDAKADLWSIGTILYELLVGRPPFNGANHMQLLRNIERGEARLPGPLAARLSPCCQSLLHRLLQRNPVERLSFDEFFAHPFLTGAPGPSAGVPPSQPHPQPASAAPPAALPPAMRQAVAAVAAAAAADAAQQRAAGSNAVRPSLHLAGPAQQQQQQQQQHAGDCRTAHQQQHASAWPLQQQPSQQEQLSRQASAPQQQRQARRAPAGPVLQPVRHHPLAPAAPASGSEVEALSDSMEDDFVVVYNPASGPPAPASRGGGSGTSSRASSGLMEPRAAAVLAGCALPPQVRLAAPQAMQQQQQPYGAAALWAAGAATQQQQQLDVPAGVDLIGGGTSSHTACGWVAPAAAPDACCPHGLQPQSAVQRVQLLVQVVRACVSLLTRQDASGEGDVPPAHLAAHVSLLLLALQLVTALCLPQDGETASSQHLGGSHQQQQDQQHQHQPPGEQADSSSWRMASLLAAASQSDLEQLMAGAVELLAHAQHISCSARGHAGDDADDEGDAAGGGGGIAGSMLQQPLPPPAAVLFGAALDACRAGAVEEAMGNAGGSLSCYSLAADLLLFLAQDWAPLGPADPGLHADARRQLGALYGAVNARLAAVVAEAPSAVLY